MAFLMFKQGGWGIAAWQGFLQLQLNCFIVRPVFKSYLALCELGKLLCIFDQVSIYTTGQ